MSTASRFRDAALRILLLEDSKFDAELLRECLRGSFPNAVLERVCGEHAFVDAISQRAFDAILSDHELPDFSGPQALQIARRLCPGTPFIFVSGVIGEDNAVELLKRGATDFVSKGRLARLPVAIDRALREVAERTARDHAENQLREADATFARVVDSLRDYAVILLDVDGHIRSWNRAAREVFGFKRSQVIGASAALLFTPEDRAADVPDTQLRVALVRGKAGGDRWMLRADGARFRAEGVVTPLYSPSGAHTGYCKIVHDATAAFEQAAALRAAKDEAERANLAKDHFLAVLSHELRTPLTPIASAAYVLERYARVPEQYRGLLPMIQRNIALEARLIDDLLDLSAISAGKVTLRAKPVDLHALIHVVIEMVAEQVRDKRQALVLRLEAADATVEADEARMEQVLWNILRNAIKFTPQGGRIELRTESDGQVIRVHCQDNGIGIEPGVLPRIFTAFEQADSDIAKRFGGLGLGLTIARWLVAEHKGRLWAHSDGLGKGSTFSLELACMDPTQALLPGETAADAVPAAEHSLLLVEDNADAATPMLLSLEHYGYRVTHAMNCAQALQAMQSARFDVVVTDLGLPDGNGVELGRTLSGIVPVIALSGYGTEHDVERTAKAGFAGHLVKPADPATVHATVQEALTRAAPGGTLVGGQREAGAARPVDQPANDARGRR